MRFTRVSTMSNPEQPNGTLKDAKRLVKQVIDERGAKFVYYPPKQLDETDDTQQSDNYGEACTNWVIKPDGSREGSCLVGKVLEAIGVLDDLPDNMQTNVARVTCANYFDDEAIHFLAAVQVSQDNKMCYGDIERDYLTDEK